MHGFTNWGWFCTQSFAFGKQSNTYITKMIYTCFIRMLCNIPLIGLAFKSRRWVMKSSWNAFLRSRILCSKWSKSKMSTAETESVKIPLEIKVGSINSTFLSWAILLVIEVLQSCLATKHIFYHLSSTIVCVLYPQSKIFLLKIKAHVVFVLWNYYFFILLIWVPQILQWFR